MSIIPQLASYLHVPEKILDELLRKYFGDISTIEEHDRLHIFICGAKQHGKTTLANALKYVFGFKCRIVSFAERLKLIGELLGVKNDDAEDKDTTYLPQFKMTKRRFYEIMGTEIGREIDENIWVRKVKEEVFMLPKEVKIVIYPDMRFPNELQYAQSCKNHIIVRVKRPGYKVPETKAHVSELFYNTFISNFDLINDGTLEQFISKCVEFGRSL